MQKFGDPGRNKKLFSSEIDLIFEVLFFMPLIPTVCRSFVYLRLQIIFSAENQHCSPHILFDFLLNQAGVGGLNNNKVGNGFICHYYSHGDPGKKQSNVQFQSNKYLPIEFKMKYCGPTFSFNHGIPLSCK